MKKSTTLKDFSELEEQVAYLQAKIKFLKEKFPDIQTKLYGSGIPFCARYSSAKVNLEYTNLDFIKKYHELIVSPYALVEFTYNGKVESIKIHSNPATSRLAYIRSNFVTESIEVNGTTKHIKNIQRTMNFSKVVINFKNNNFSDSMLNDCRLKIIEMIQKYPKMKLNTKHLDERIKKLLIFN